MSKLAKKPIQIPDKVKVVLKDDIIKVKGPKGELEQKLYPSIKIVFDEQNSNLKVDSLATRKNEKGIQGLFFSLISNMIFGVTTGYSKEMEIIGLGYNAKVQGTKLVLQIGFNQPVTMEIPKGLDVDVTNPSNPAKLVVKGIDKQLLGQFAANIRKIRPPEPYKGKGIKYADEIIRRKAGKALST